MDVAKGALCMLQLNIRQLWAQLRLCFTHPHKSFLAEGTKHVIPCPSSGSGMDRVLEADAGQRSGRRLCAARAAMMVLSL